MQTKFSLCLVLQVTSVLSLLKKNRRLSAFICGLGNFCDLSGINQWF